MVEAMDGGIGKILQVLEDNSFDSETIVVFFSDNGGARVASNGILSGYKGHVYEGGIRVPCLVRWPGKIEGNTLSDQVSISFDISYSILDIAGADPARIAKDGYDILGHVAGDLQDFDRTLYWRAKRGNSIKKAVRDGNYKYLTEIRNDSMHFEKLFRLDVDISEQHDLSESRTGITDSLKKKISAWEKEVTAHRLKPYHLLLEK
jgi:N-acetylgalactosamine-6-sulfatase